MTDMKPTPEEREKFEKEALRPELSNNELHALTCSAIADTHGPEIRTLAERTNDPLAVHIVSHWGDETEEKLK